MVPFSGLLIPFWWPSLCISWVTWWSLEVIQWSADDCVDNLSSLGAGAYCSICDSASKGCAAMAFLSIATGLVNIWTVAYLLFQIDLGLSPLQWQWPRGISHLQEPPIHDPSLFTAGRRVTLKNHHVLLQWNLCVVVLIHHWSLDLLDNRINSGW